MPIGLKGNSDGSGAIQIGGSDAISISTGLNTTFAGTVTATGTVAGTTGTLYPIVSGTAVASTSGTAIDFTGIPSWVKRITVMLSGVSTNGTSNYVFQVGAGSIATTGYNSGAVGVSVSTINTTNGSASNTTTSITTAGYTSSAASVAHGHVVFTNISGNTWVVSGSLYIEGVLRVATFAGSVALGGTLDRVRITTNGGDTFDAGTINLFWE